MEEEQEQREKARQDAREQDERKKRDLEQATRDINASSMQERAAMPVSLFRLGRQSPRPKPGRSQNMVRHRNLPVPFPLQLVFCPCSSSRSPSFPLPFRPCAVTLDQRSCWWQKKQYIIKGRVLFGLKESDKNQLRHAGGVTKLKSKFTNTTLWELRSALC